jgi:hypothetical protein
MYDSQEEKCFVLDFTFEYKKWELWQTALELKNVNKNWNGNFQDKVEKVWD